MALCFLVAHDDEAGNDDDPVQIVGDDRAVGRRVLPAENGIEDTPSATAIEFRVTELDGIRTFQESGMMDDSR